MINIEKVFDNIVRITDEDYEESRLSVMEHLFNTLDITVLDYEIRLAEKHPSLLKTDICAYPTDFDGDFISSLKKLEGLDAEVGGEFKLILDILAILE